jgi:hypothetical protein
MGWHSWRCRFFCFLDKAPRRDPFRQIVRAGRYRLPHRGYISPYRSRRSRQAAHISMRSAGCPGRPSSVSLPNFSIEKFSAHGAFHDQNPPIILPGQVLR